MKYIILDSEPLGLVTHPKSVQKADACKAWLSQKISQHCQIVVPEIIDYEIRRELIRSGKTSSIRRLDQFISDQAVRYQPITTAVMRTAADFWAKVRNQGSATAHPHAIDVDMILAAQVLSAGFDAGQFVVATSNVRHLALLVPAAECTKI